MKHSASILYIMGGKTSDIKALEQATDIAKESRANVTMLEILESLPASARMLITAVPAAELKNSVISKRLHQIEELISMIKPDSIGLQVRVRFGNRAKEIAREADAGGYDLVIKHPEKGRVDKYLSRHCQCALQLLKADGSLPDGQSVASLIAMHQSADRKRRSSFPVQQTAHTFVP